MCIQVSVTIGIVFVGVCQPHSIKVMGLLGPSVMERPILDCTVSSEAPVKATLPANFLETSDTIPKD